MAERKMTAQAVKDLVAFYQSLPAATFFKGLTGYGFQVKEKVDSVGEITSSSGIIHPSYIFMVGGEASGRRTLQADDIKTAVEYFQNNPLAADLRVTSGKGFKMSGGMAEFVDVKECQSQTTFEITHYGGRSISPAFVQELGRVADQNIKWQSGFEYKDAQSGKNLVLIRHLTTEEWDSQDRLDRVWADLQKEVTRLMLFHCEDKLRGNMERQEQLRIFMTQELNGYLDGAGAIQLPTGYQHEIRNDGVVMVRKSLRNAPTDETGFQAAIDEFNKVSFGTYNLYCQPLGDNPPVGKPQNDVFGLAEVEEVSFDKDSRRSTESKESLIGWSSKTPVFPQDEWTAEKGKSYRVILHRWGKGYRATPAPPVYKEVAVQKNADTAEVGLTRIEYDGSEKFLGGREVTLETAEEFKEGSWFAERLEFVDEGCLIVEKKTDLDFHKKQAAKNGEIIWEVVSTDKFPYERSTIADKAWLDCSWNDRLLELDPSKYGWNVKAEVQTGEAILKGNKSDVAWADLPEWLQEQHNQQWPICACGRERYEAAKFTECNKCRNYRDCPRCGKLEQYFGAERIAGGATCCSDCASWYEKPEQWIHIHLTPEHLDIIRDEAKDLLTGKPVDEGNIEVDDKIFSTNFSREELEFISQLPGSGNDLAKGIWWVCNGTQRGMSSDFDESRVIKLKDQLEKKIMVLGNYVGPSETITKAVGELKEQITPYFYRSSAIVGKHPFDDEREKEIGVIWARASGSPSKASLEALKSLLPIIEEINEYREKLAECQSKIQGAIEQHFTKCPLCSEDLVNRECQHSDNHPDGVVDFPVDDEGNNQRSTVLSELVTETGEIIAELRCYSGENRRDAFNAVRLIVLEREEKLFESIVYKDNKMIMNPEDVKRRREYLRKLNEKSQYRDRVGRLKDSGAILLGPFTLGEYKGKPNASVKHGKITYIVNGWQVDRVEEGRQYYCQVDREFSATTVFVSPIEEVMKIEEGAEEEKEINGESSPDVPKIDLNELKKFGKIKIGLG